MDQVAALLKQADVFAGERRWDDASAVLRKAVDLAPGHAAGLIQLSYVESARGDYRNAREFALRAARVPGMRPELVVELLGRLRTFNEADAFHRCLAGLPPLARIPIPQLISIGAQLSYFNEQDKALHFLDEAARADPDYPPTLAARGQVLTFLGRFDEARVVLERCARRAPRLAQAWWLLSRLGLASGRSDRIAAVRRQLSQSGLRADDVAVLSFALHNELDAQGDHDAAWAALEQACSAKRSLLRYSTAESAALVDALIDTPVATRPGEGFRSPTRRPVFIVGMHRSGTTLLEQLLDRHSAVRGLGELYDFTHQMRFATDHHCRGAVDTTIVRRARDLDLTAVGRGYLAGLEWRLGAEPVCVDKLPSNFLNLGFICRALPDARILHLRRDPVETCFSNLRELFSDACPYSYDQQELAAYYRQYERLMRHWREAFPDRILDIGYAELVGDTESTMRRVAAFCGFDFEAASLERSGAGRGVATASAVQVRQAVALPDRPKWAPYADHLRPLRAALQA